MKFTPGSLHGSWVVELEPVVDHRGFFARAWCEDEFRERGLSANWPQQNLQHSPAPGTMRGLHYQAPPHAEIKLVRCTRGAVFDVALDLRPHSSTYRRWMGTELRAESHNSVWVPAGCAHGYLTLEPDSEVFYLTSKRYVPAAVRGIRYDDPGFGIPWPRPIELVPADYDTWPDFSDTKAAEMAALAETGELL